MAGADRVSEADGSGSEARVVACRELEFPRGSDDELQLALDPGSETIRGKPCKSRVLRSCVSGEPCDIKFFLEAHAVRGDFTPVSWRLAEYGARLTICNRADSPGVNREIS